MTRGNFLRNLLGLAGVATSAKEIAKIGSRYDSPPLLYAGSYDPLLPAGLHVSSYEYRGYTFRFEECELLSANKLHFRYTAGPPQNNFAYFIPKHIEHGRAAVNTKETHVWAEGRSPEFLRKPATAPG